MGIKWNLDTHFLNGCAARGSSKPQLKLGPFGSMDPFTAFSALHKEMHAIRMINE